MNRRAFFGALAGAAPAVVLGNLVGEAATIQGETIRGVGNTLEERMTSALFIDHDNRCSCGCPSYSYKQFRNLRFDRKTCFWCGVERR